MQTGRFQKCRDGFMDYWIVVVLTWCAWDLHPYSTEPSAWLERECCVSKRRKDNDLSINIQYSSMSIIYDKCHPGPKTSSTGTFVVIAKNTLNGSNWSIILLCPKSLRYQVMIKFNEDKIATVHISKHCEQSAMLKTSFGQFQRWFSQY